MKRPGGIQRRRSSPSSITTSTKTPCSSCPQPSAQSGGMPPAERMPTGADDALRGQHREPLALWAAGERSVGLRPPTSAPTAMGSGPRVADPGRRLVRSGASTRVVSSGTAKAEVVVPVLGVVPVADRRADVPGGVVLRASRMTRFRLPDRRSSRALCYASIRAGASRARASCSRRHASASAFAVIARAASIIRWSSAASRSPRA